MSTNNSPLLSIVIPTKDRYECLIPVINTILKHVISSDFELVIHDNSISNDSVLPFFNNHVDSRLKYFYVKDYLSMVDNTLLAINQSKGKYATFIGDDDLVSPFICEITKLLDKKNIDCLIYNSGYYWWDSVVFHKSTPYKNKRSFWLPKKITNTLIPLDSNIEMNKVLKNGGVHYGNLPRFYHGIVKRTVLDEINSQTGSYLPGHCPDMSFAASISQVIDRYYFMNYPVTVFGASKNSGAGWGENKSHFGKIEEMKFLPRGIINKWNPRLPKIWSGQTTNAQTLFEVFQAFRVEKEINYGEFYASMLVNEPFLRKYITPILSTNINISLYFVVLKGYIYNYSKLSIMHYYLLFRFYTGTFKLEVLEKENIDECMKELLKFPII